MCYHQMDDFQGSDVLWKILHLHADKMCYRISRPGADTRRNETQTRRLP